MRSRKFWVTILAMFLMIISPLVTENSSSLISSIALVSATYLGGQGAVDAFGAYKKGK